MYPKLLELPWQIAVVGQITLYTYGLLLAAAYLLGLKLAMVRAKARGLDPAAFLTDNDSTGFFSALGDLLVPGPTFTNVNDFRAIVVDRT